MTGAEKEPTADSPRRASIASKLGYLVAGLLLALVAAELLVDRWLPVGGVIYRVDDTLLHDARPNAARIQKMPRTRLGPGDAARVRVATGELGLRGGLPKGADAARVLVLGDSLVMAENVPEDRTFVARLGEELGRAAGVPVAALNAGRSGYGPDQSLLLFEKIVDEVKPAAVVVVLCAHNDFGDLMRNKLFRTEDGELRRLTPNVGTRMREWFQGNETAASKLALVRLFHFFADGGGAEERIDADVMPLYLAALGAQFDEHWVRRDDEVISLFEDVYDADIALGVAPERAEIKRDLMTRVLGELVSAAKSRGLPLAFAVVPSAVDVCPGFGITVDARSYAGYEAGRLAALMSRAASDAGAPALDLSVALTSGGRAPERFVGGTDIHWNAAGQADGATAVARWLMDLGGWTEALSQ